MNMTGKKRGSPSVRRVAALLSVLAALAASAWDNAAAAETCMAGGIGGTGAQVGHGGIGGTGAPETSPSHGGIGGTGSPAQVASPSLAGRIVFAKGEVRAEAADAAPRLLAKGAVVCEREVVATGAGAFAQIAMADGGTLILREKSALKIESFTFSGVEDGSERAEFILREGGFRAITGAIGHSRKEAYAIRTPNATISIRGTDHETYYVPPLSAGNVASAAPGTYNRVLSGGTTLRTDTGQLSIDPGQTGFAPIGGNAPSLLQATPPFLAAPLPKPVKQTIPPPGEKPTHVADANNNGATAEAGGSPSSFAGPAGMSAAEGMGSAPANDAGAPSTAGQPTEIQPIQLANGIGLNTTSTEPSVATLQDVPDQTAYVGLHLINGTATHGSLVTDGVGSVVQLDANGNPYYVADDASGFNYQAQGNPALVDSGSATVDGVLVNWGIYAGGITNDANGNGTPVDFHHFAFAPGGATPPSVIANLSGTATFSTVVGFTKPTSEQGVLGGTVNAVSVDVLFGAAPAVTGYGIDVTDAHARQWNGSFAGNTPLSSFATGGVPLAVTCNGTGCGSGSGTGAAGGQLIGANAKGMISGYSLGTSTNQSVSGIVILSRP